MTEPLAPPQIKFENKTTGRIRLSRLPFLPVFGDDSAISLSSSYHFWLGYKTFRGLSLRILFILL